MEYQEFEPSSGEKIVGITFTDEQWNLMAESNCDNVRALESGAALAHARRILGLGPQVGSPGQVAPAQDDG